MHMRWGRCLFVELFVREMSAAAVSTQDAYKNPTAPWIAGVPFTQELALVHLFCRAMHKT